MKDVFFLGLAASALHRMNLLLWQTWNGSSWGVASMENSTCWILRQGGTGALFPSSPFSRFYNYMTIYEHSGVHHTFTLKKVNWHLTDMNLSHRRTGKRIREKQMSGKTSCRREGSWTGRHFHGCHCRGETDQDRYLLQSSSSTFQHPVFAYQKNSRFQAPKNRPRTT